MNMQLFPRQTVFLALALCGLLLGCSGRGASPKTIPSLVDPVPVELSQGQLEVIRRDVNPSIRNAVAEGTELDVATAEFSQLQAVRADGKTYVCGFAKALNINLEITRDLAFTGELVSSALFVREFIGGNQAQNEFVRDVCRKRGMALD
jgi:hypothetical protein